MAAQPKPLDLIQAKHDELDKSLDKSLEAYRTGMITKQEHNVHVLNLVPVILDYKRAIAILTSNNL